MSQYQCLKFQASAYNWLARISDLDKTYDSRNGEVDLCRRRALVPCQC